MHDQLPFHWAFLSWIGQMVSEHPCPNPLLWVSSNEGSLRECSLIVEKYCLIVFYQVIMMNDRWRQVYDDKFHQ